MRIFQARLNEFFKFNLEKKSLSHNVITPLSLQIPERISPRSSRSVIFLEGRTKNNGFGREEGADELTEQSVALSFIVTF